MLRLLIATETNFRKALDAARKATMSSALMFSRRMLPSELTVVLDLNPRGCLVSGSREV